MAPQKIQPWKGKWPQNISTITPVDPTAFPFATGPGKGAQPNEAHSADGTKVMRIDEVDKFVKQLKDNKGNHWYT
jgi:hypothetical protein